MIELRNLSGGGGAYAPVQNLQCKLNNGGVIGVTGGAESATLLALLAGALLPRDGAVKINGFDTRHESARAKALIGYLPRDYAPDGTATPMEFLLFAADLRGVPYERALRRAQDLLDTVGLLSKRDTLISRLWAGECRLLSVAQALMSAPEFILLDAPFAGLGPRAAQTLREWIVQMGENATVFVSSDTPSDLDRICTRAIVLDGGRIAELCTVTGEQFSKEFAHLLTKTAPATPVASANKKKSRWKLLLDSTAEEEIIDIDDGKGEERK